MYINTFIYLTIIINIIIILKFPITKKYMKMYEVITCGNSLNYHTYCFQSVINYNQKIIIHNYTNTNGEIGRRGLAHSILIPFLRYVHHFITIYFNT